MPVATYTVSDEHLIILPEEIVERSTLPTAAATLNPPGRRHPRQGNAGDSDGADEIEMWLSAPAVVALAATVIVLPGRAD